MYRGCLTGRPYPLDTLETQLFPSCTDSSHSSNVQGTCFTSREAQSRDTHENSSGFNCLSLHTHSLLHTTLTSKSHNKYRVQNIEYNFNQIWHGIKANKIHICKSQLYNLPIWLFRDKTPKTDSRLKREFGNNGKTHSHLIQKL